MRTIFKSCKQRSTSTSGELGDACGRASGGCCHQRSDAGSHRGRETEYREIRDGPAQLIERDRTECFDGLARALVRLEVLQYLDEYPPDVPAIVVSSETRERTNNLTRRLRIFASHRDTTEKICERAPGQTTNKS